jgi:ornithine carbamoyltransferase
MALDLKAKGANVKLCQDTSCTVFYEDIITKAGLVKGISNSGAVATSIHASHLPADLNLDYFARAIASGSSVIFAQAPWTEEQLEELASGSNKPVITVQSKESAPLLCLAECMTLYEHYSYLRRLTLAFLGPVEDQIARTYIQLLPKIGLHFRYASDSQFSDDLWSKGIEFSGKNSFPTDLLQFSTPEEAIFRADVIIAHPETKLKLSAKDMKEAELDWTFLHHDIHLGSSCSKQLLRSKHSLVWKYVENIQWIAQALVVATTCGYKPSIPLPGFKGKP